MLHRNLFNRESKERENMMDNTFRALSSFSDETSLILKVDNLEVASRDVYHIFPSEIALPVAKILSQEESKNVFLVNEAISLKLQNNSTTFLDNFYKLYSSLTKMLKRRSVGGSNVNILNIQSLNTGDEGLAKVLVQESRERANDIAILRNLGGLNIFVPADGSEAEYLLSMVEQNFFKRGEDNFSYFKLVSSNSPMIFESEYFKLSPHLKEWTGIPEIVYFSKNLEAPLDIAIIACGPILYNALLAARELEKRNYKVTVVNMSLITSSSPELNENIYNFLSNFSKSHKSIVTVEEHSNVGGMGSLVSEIVSGDEVGLSIRVRRMGLEDDLSPRNIVEQAEEVSRM